jgi:2-keto-3-deoxy-L-fuconate dehydrogenase
MFDLQRKVAAITGAGSGIGAAIAALFAARGGLVIALDIDRDAAERTVEEIRRAGGAAEAHRCDVAGETDVNAIFSRIGADHQRLDILVNNAGIAHVGTIETTTLHDFERVYRVNVLCARGPPSR